MSVSANIWKLQIDRFLSECLFFVAILVPFFESNGLKPSEIFLVETIFAGTIVLCEIPTGYLSDAVGRKTALLMGAILYPFSHIAYGLSQGFWDIAFAEVLGAVAISLRSGSDTSLLYETLLNLGREKEHKKIEGRFYFLQRAGSSSANILGGFLATLWIRLPFFVTAIIVATRIPLILSMTETNVAPKEKKTPRQHLAEMKQAIRYTATHPVLRNTVLYGAIITGLNLIGYWSYYLFYTRLGFPLAVFGILGAAKSLMAGVGSGIAHTLEKKLNERILILLPLLIAPSYMLIGYLNDMWALALVLTNSLLWGLSIPVLRDILHKNAKPALRATILSTMSLGERLGYVLFATAIGFLIEKTSLQTGFIVLGSLFGLLCALPVWGLLRSDKIGHRKHNPTK